MLMVSLEDAIVARYAHGERRFEILVDPEKAMELRSGKSVPIEELLATAEIFKDARKGERAGEKELKEAFGTVDAQKIAEEIVKKGTIQLTTEQRRRALEEKKRQIVSYIARSAINPQTNAPHTPQRIERAMEEARVSIDPFRSVEEQATKIIDAIRYKIPIKIENALLEIILSPQDYGRCNQLLKEYGRFREQGWLSDGKFRCVLEVPAGIKGEFMDMLGRRARDEASIKEQGRGKR
ncbi:MAG: ribosome assembly factor SBDS [Candidatus Thermoplasmatota archaeon]|nr:ribosome assembly factor SBDS [Candidatus Thermoplasmatota archaeon]